MIEYFQKLSNIELIFLIIGFVGQGLFASRFIVQWIYSEKVGKSTIPIIFWYLSIFGGIGLLIYAISRKDPVIITGQIFGMENNDRNLPLYSRPLVSLDVFHARVPSPACQKRKGRPGQAEFDVPTACKTQPISK